VFGQAVDVFLVGLGLGLEVVAERDLGGAEGVDFVLEFPFHPVPVLAEGFQFALEVGVQGFPVRGAAGFGLVAGQFVLPPPPGADDGDGPD
jgi:hypothetical protein